MIGWSGALEHPLNQRERAPAAGAYTPRLQANRHRNQKPERDRKFAPIQGYNTGGARIEHITDEERRYGPRKIHRDALMRTHHIRKRSVPLIRNWTSRNDANGIQIVNRARQEHLQATFLG